MGMEVKRKYTRNNNNMIIGLKCSFCDFFLDINLDKSIMEAHEKKCAWNKENKMCVHCKSARWDWEGDTINSCFINKNYNLYMAEPKCPDWEGF